MRSSHTRSAGTGVPTLPTLPTVAAYIARLGLATYALAGLLTLDRLTLTTPLHPAGYLTGYPGLVTATSGLCALTWLAHRNARPRATRAGAILLLGAALAHTAYLITVHTTPGGPDLAAAGCTLLLLGGVAGCAVAGAGRPTPLAAAKPACPRQRPRRSLRLGLRAAAYAVFMSSFWASLDTALPQPWVTLTLSVCMWSADLNSHGGLTTHHPARQRAAALLGVLLLPTALVDVHLVHVQLSDVELSHGLAAEASGHPIVARLAAVATLALTLVLAASCWWLSRGHANGATGRANGRVNGRVTGRDTQDPASSTPTRRQHGQAGPPTGSTHSPRRPVAGSRWLPHNPAQPTPENNRSSDPAGAPDSSSGPRPVTGTETAKRRSPQPETANARPRRAT